MISPLLLLLPVAAANDDGIVGFAWSGCTDCHGEAASPEVVVDLVASATTVKGGQTVDLALTVQSSNADHKAAGLDVAVSAGTLVPGATMLWRKYELTHQFPHPTSDGQQVFTFSWVAPAWGAEVTVAAAGNAVNYDGSASGDGWGTDSLLITVVSDCQDADGDLVGDCESDCDDTDPQVHPGAEETWYDGIDQDCAGDDDDDADGDGAPLEEDCDDGDPTVAAAGECDSGEPGTADGGADGGGADGGAADGGVADGGVADGGGDGGGGTKGCAAVPGGGLLLALGAGLLGLRRRR